MPMYGEGGQFSPLSTIPTDTTNKGTDTNILLVLNGKILYNQGETIPPFFDAGRLSMDMIKVSANSRTSAVAGAIAGVIREHKHAEVQAIGAGAVNQAVKALVLATGYLKNDGIEVVCVPEFVDVEIEDKVRTAIKLVIEPRQSSANP